jgi:hypothetical protein
MTTIMTMIMMITTAMTITVTIMTKPTSRKPATSAPGVKLLITAASLAATVGGWAVLGTKEPKPAAPPAPLAPIQAAAPAVPIKLAPLPTLVPPITPQLRPPPRSQLVTIDQPRSAAPRPAAAAVPQAVAPAELVLRDVSAPLPHSAPQVNGGGSAAAAAAPVVNTGSSR